MGDDEAHEDAPEEGDPRSRDWVPPPRHVAADRAAAISLRAAQDIADALADAEVPEEPVVLNRRGPQTSIDGLDRLLAAAIDETGDEAGDDTGDDTGEDTGEDTEDDTEEVPPEP
jgi:hypothetical protein